MASQPSEATPAKHSSVPRQLQQTERSVDRRWTQPAPVDESSEGYLFAADRFVALEVPTAVRASLLKASRA